LAVPGPVREKGLGCATRCGGAAVPDPVDQMIQPRT